MTNRLTVDTLRRRVLPKTKKITKSQYKDILQKVTILQDVVYNSILPAEIKVYRGFKSASTYAVGDILRSPAFTSTSLSIEEAMYFRGISCCLFQILLPSGSHALPLLGDIDGIKYGTTSHFNNELEILLPSNTTLKIINIKKYYGITIYIANVISQSKELATPGWFEHIKATTDQSPKWPVEMDYEDFEISFKKQHDSIRDKIQTITKRMHKKIDNILENYDILFKAYFEAFSIDTSYFNISRNYNHRKHNESLLELDMSYSPVQVGSLK